ncbi:MAG: hypothetical protein IKA50_05140 [Clostridia bacterium]|nr:hypothetical protein [Clostridia bacterium]
MKLTKRILCLALVLALTFALCACGKDKKENDDSASTNPGGFSTQPSTQTTVDPWDGNLEGDNHFNDATLAW